MESAEAAEIEQVAMNSKHRKASPIDISDLMLGDEFNLRWINRSGESYEYLYFSVFNGATSLPGLGGFMGF